MIQSLPYCRRCDLPVNDGVRGMYCRCAAHQQKAAEETAFQARKREITRQRALEKTTALAEFAAEFDRSTWMQANWRPAL
jgi:hypothetical protein